MHKKDKDVVGAEPPDVPDKPLAGVAQVQGRPCQAAKVVVNAASENPLDAVPEAFIPGEQLWSSSRAALSMLWKALEAYWVQRRAGATRTMGKSG